MRTLTMIRKKTIVASIMKAFLYTEVVGKGELNINGKELVQLAVIKNGKQATVEIPDHELSVFIVFDKTFPNKFHTEYRLPAGTENVTLYTKAHFNPFKGNPFVITTE